MLILMDNDCARQDRIRVEGVVEGLGHRADAIELGDRFAVRVSGYDQPPHPELFEALPGVAAVLPVSTAVRHSHRAARQGDTVISLGDHRIGGGGFTLIAGPCAVENEDQLLEVARAVRSAGANVLRGGAYKPRTSPYDFQGLGEDGLRLLARAREESGLPVITEAVDERSLELVELFADMVQIGARNMQNFALLKRVGRSKLPVMIKRGMSASLDDLMQSAEYVLNAGNPNVVLCERGVRTFSNHSRYTLDLAIVPVLKRMTHLPVLVDPSHASGNRHSVAPLARASLAAGADGVMVEVHGDPGHALCDGPQSLLPEAFRELAADLRALAPLVARQREPVSQARGC